jgi:hypothetical protein
MVRGSTFLIPTDHMETLIATRDIRRSIIRAEGAARAHQDVAQVAIGPSDLSNITRFKNAALEWAAQSAAPRSRKKIRVMGERDIISATALFAFYDEVSH